MSPEFQPIAGILDQDIHNKDPRDLVDSCFIEPYNPRLALMKI